jgi:hypothetical protein
MAATDTKLSALVPQTDGTVEIVVRVVNINTAEKARTDGGASVHIDRTRQTARNGFAKQNTVRPTGQQIKNRSFKR